MSLMAANEESDPSAILNGFWVTLFFCSSEIVFAYIVDLQYYVNYKRSKNVVKENVLYNITYL